MGGTAPYCPFCHKLLSCIKDHIKVKHPDKYQSWINHGQPPYWRYNDEGELIETCPKEISDSNS